VVELEVVAEDSLLRGLGDRLALRPGLVDGMRGEVGHGIVEDGAVPRRVDVLQGGIVVVEEALYSREGVERDDVEFIHAVSSWIERV